MPLLPSGVRALFVPLCGEKGRLICGTASIPVFIVSPCCPFRWLSISLRRLRKAIRRDYARYVANIVGGNSFPSACGGREVGPACPNVMAGQLSWQSSWRPLDANSSRQVPQHTAPEAKRSHSLFTHPHSRKLVRPRTCLRKSGLQVPNCCYKLLQLIRSYMPSQIRILSMLNDPRMLYLRVSDGQGTSV